MKKWTWIAILLALCVAPVSAQPPVKLVTCDWAPYFGTTMKNQGPLAEVTIAAFEHAGRKAEIEFMDWNRAVALTESGRAEGLLGCYHAPEREKVMAISDPVGDVTIVFFALKERNLGWNSLEDLKPFKIGAMRGNKFSPEFDAADYLNKEYVNALESNIKKLLAGRVDLIVESKFVAQDVINAKFSGDRDKITMLSPPLKTNSLHIGISRKVQDFQAIHKDLNKGLAAIRADGTMDSILKAHGF